MDLLQLLAQKGYIRESDISALRAEIDQSGEGIETVLEKRGIIKEDILKTKSELSGNIPYKDLDGQYPSFDVLKLFPEKTVDHYRIIPLALSEGVLEVGFVDPDDLEARDAVQFITSRKNMPFKAFVISERDFKKIRESYAGLSGEVGKALTELESELSKDEEEVSRGIEEIGSVTTAQEETQIIEDAPVTKIVATILKYATEGGASDVHIEPMNDKVRVRFRIDGVLHTSLVLPRKVLSAVVARIKILSDMKLDEKRKPQDGRFSAHIDNRKIDFRVSTFPTYYGEKVVMRILDSQKGIITLEGLGMNARSLQLIKEAIAQPYGMILISGPTGSGKTTTLYSLLQEIDREGKNVLSLEDPVEYSVAGVNQSQIFPEIGYTFANGLRTTLRQDPDIIMVGEIRDKETAALAVQAALTGHLVLSTIHTNNAVGVIPRLIDMGVDPYLITPTLILSIAQRLVRKLCPGSGKKIPVEGSIKMMIEKEFSDLPAEFKKDVEIPEYVYGIAPSSGCPNGTRGRTAVFEMFPMTKSVEASILEDPNEANIYNAVRKDGMFTMKEDALTKAFKHEVPFEEINKV